MGNLNCGVCLVAKGIQFTMVINLTIDENDHVHDCGFDRCVSFVHNMFMFQNLLKNVIIENNDNNELVNQFYTFYGTFCPTFITGCLWTVAYDNLTTCFPESQVSVILTSSHG
jgi:hypothetical protein